MKESEKIGLIKKTITSLYNTNGYIKGFGPKLCRVMDGNHNPLYNVSREVINQMLADNKIKLDGVIYKLNLEV